MTEASARQKNVIDHALFPRRLRHLPDGGHVFLLEDRIIGLRCGHKIAEQALLIVGEMAAVVLIAEEQAIFSSDLPYLDHILATRSYGVVKRRSLDP